MTKDNKGNQKTFFRMVCDSIRACKACQRKQRGLCISHQPFELYLHDPNDQKELLRIENIIQGHLYQIQVALKDLNPQDNAWSVAIKRAEQRRVIQIMNEIFPTPLVLITFQKEGKE